MKIKCPDCGKAMELEVQISVSGEGCEFCKLSLYQKKLIFIFIVCRGNVSEMVDLGWGSREFIDDKLGEIMDELHTAFIEEKPLSKPDLLDDSNIRSIIETIDHEHFTTDPDFIEAAKNLNPAIIEHYQSSSPRNWKARIGRRLSLFASEFKTIAKAGRKGNSQIWRKVS
jgi:hypothetical protein